MHSLFTLRRARLAIFTILAAAAWSAVPAHAGAVYAPVIANQVGDVQFTSQVVVESVSGAEQRILQGPDDASPMGWLVLDADPEVRITASALGRTPNGEEVVLPLPLLSPSQAVPGGSAVSLVGMRRGRGVHSHLYLVSWEKGANECTIQVLDRPGTTVLGATTTSLESQALTPLLDVVTTISGVEVPESRLEVSCQRAFSAFATVHGVGSQDEPLAATVFPLVTMPRSATAAGLVASSQQQAPGAENFEGECLASVARHCYYLPGTFFAPAKKTGNQKRAVFPVSRGDYDRVRLRMDVLYGGPNPRNPRGLQQIFWMAINSRNVDLVGFTSVRKANTALMQRAGIGTGPGAKSKVIRDARLVKGQTYLMDYLYDASAGVIVWNVIERSSGRLVESIVDRPNVRAVRFGSDGHMGVDVSMNGSNRDEPPSYGWVYSDLVFEIFD